MTSCDERLTRKFFTGLAEYNDRHSSGVANHKLMAKEVLSRNDFPVPETYDVIRATCDDDISGYDFGSLPSSFVMKGALGNCGDAVVVVTGRSGEDFVVADGGRLSRENLVGFALRIYHGDFTPLTEIYVDATGRVLGERNVGDVVFFEELLESCEEALAEPLVVGGIVDVRLYYWKLVPVHGQIRYPTDDSCGLSNLSEGGRTALVGMDGVTSDLGLLPGNEAFVEDGNGERLVGFEVPWWRDILELGSRITHLFRLNHSCVDIGLTSRGPVVLELHGGTSDEGWNGVSDTRNIVHRIWEVERNIDRISGVSSALELADEIYHEHDGEPFDFDAFVDFMERGR